MGLDEIELKVLKNLTLFVTKSKMTREKGYKQSSLGLSVAKESIGNVANEKCRNEIYVNLYLVLYSIHFGFRWRK